MHVPELKATIEVVLGRLGDERAAQILEFWTVNGALDEEAGRRRLPEVVCVLVDDDSGAILGVNSAFADSIALVGGREFWVYRSFLLPGAAGARDPMIYVAFKALELAFDPGAPGPIGLALLVDDPGEIARRPQAEWVYPPALYAGYLPDGRQVRLRYFAGARVSAPRSISGFDVSLDHSYRVDLFAEQSEVDPEAIIAMWRREGAVPEDEARRRIHEVLAVATHGSSEPAGVTTVYLQHNPQLGLDLWHYRVFVAAEHRFSRVGLSLGLVTYAHLEQRFAGGHDLRAPGVLFEVEHEIFKTRFDEVQWLPLGVTFIGENERGDHLRVRYFPGGLAPGPPE